MIVELGAFLITAALFIKSFFDKSADDLLTDLRSEMRDNNNASRVEEILQKMAGKSCVAGPEVVRIAIDDDNADILELLLRYKSDPNGLLDQRTPLLYYACKGNKMEAVMNCLLPSGANPNNPERDAGNLPLQEAALNDNARMVESLLAYGADVNGVNKSKQTALMEAAKNNALSAARALLHHIADIAMTDEFGKNALAYAKEGDCQDMTVLLNSYSCDVETLKHTISEKPGIASYRPKAEILAA